MRESFPAIDHTVAATPVGRALGAASIALDDEARIARQTVGSSGIPLFDGRMVFRDGEEELWRFDTPPTPPLSPETPVSVESPGRTTRQGSLVSLEDSSVTLGLSGHDTAARLDKARLLSDASFIPAKMRDRLTSALAATASDDFAIAAALAGVTTLPPGDDRPLAEATARVVSAMGDGAHAPNAMQRVAMSRAAGSRLHLVWGPPGTGKTATLALIARMLLDAGERVLVLAHANVAVDQALLAIASVLPDVDHGALRLGIPRLPELAARGDLTTEGILARERPELMADLRAARDERDHLARRLGENPNHGPALQAARRRVRELELARRSAEAALLADARLVAATLSRLALDDRLFGWDPDTVLLDEVGTVGIAPALMAGLAARKRLVAFGDFRQLAPVVLAETGPAAQWLHRDAFDSTGARDAADSGSEHPLMTMLDTQYRMVDEIAGPVSALAYGGRLRTVASTSAKRVAGARPRPGARAMLYDTSTLGAWALRDEAVAPGSRANPLSALAAISLAAQAAADGASVAIVTPYRTQALLLGSALRDLEQAGVDAATVHRFQGSERDVVVVDLVDAPPLDRVSRLTGAHDDATRRLVNVALSRARGKVVVLADVPFFRANSPAGSPVLQVFALLAEHGEVCSLAPRAIRPFPGIEWAPTPDAAGASATTGGDATRVVGTAGVGALIRGTRFAALVARSCGGHPRPS